MPIAVLRCTSLGLFAYFATARTAFAISGCVWFARQPHHAPHKLAKRPITHGFVLVEFLELQTSRERVFPPRGNTKPRPRFFQKTRAAKSSKCQHSYASKTATSIPPPLAQVVDWDKAIQVFTGLIVAAINSHCKDFIHMNYYYYVD